GLRRRQREVDRAVEMRRVVVALPQVAAVELPGGLQCLSVARDRRVDNCGAREILLTEDAAKAIERGCLDVQREVRRTGVVERNGALTFGVEFCTVGHEASQAARPIRSLASVSAVSCVLSAP